MQDLATLRAGGYRDAGLTKLKISEPLGPDGFPQEIFALGETLELLDLSGTGLASLPDDFAAGLPRLRIAFFSGCRFARFPAAALAGCARLEMLAFRSNGMTEVPAAAFAGALGRQLRWLILTDNRLAALPASIGCCARLEKCMLAGNRLTALPDAMAGCRRLTLLRLAANRLPQLPAWLLADLPRLAFLSFAGNPCASAAPSPPLTSGPSAEPSATSSALSLALPSAALPHIDYDQIEIHHVLGQGASGVISKGVVKTGGANTPASGTQTPLSPSALPPFTGVPAEDVAIKIFRGALTSDGTPYDEMAASIAAGRHVNLVRVHGQIRFAEEEEEKEAGGDGGDDDDDDDENRMAAEFRGGLIMELIPPHYRVLGQPPSFDSCTRDSFADGAAPLTAAAALAVLRGVAAAAAHLHARGIAHGDLYAHNILVAGHDDDNDNDGTHALLSDFGAATLYGGGDHAGADALEKIEVLAFAHLVEDVLGLLTTDAAADTLRQALTALHKACVVETVAQRPTFEQIVLELA